MCITSEFIILLWSPNYTFRQMFKYCAFSAIFMIIVCRIQTYRRCLKQGTLYKTKYLIIDINNFVNADDINCCWRAIMSWDYVSVWKDYECSWRTLIFLSTCVLRIFHRNIKYFCSKVERRICSHLFLFIVAFIAIIPS